MEAGNIERFHRRKVRRAARAPKGFHRGIRLALDPAFQGGDPRQRHMAAEAVETLHADERAELPSSAREKP